MAKILEQFQKSMVELYRDFKHVNKFLPLRPVYRLLPIRIRFVKDLYFRINFYVKHACNKLALYPLHNIENYLFLKNLEMIALFVTACRFC